jgi:hypothetical protein
MALGSGQAVEMVSPAEIVNVTEFDVWVISTAAGGFC